MVLDEIYKNIEANNKKIADKKKEIVEIAERNINLYSKLKKAIKEDK